MLLRFVTACGILGNVTGTSNSDQGRMRCVRTELMELAPVEPYHRLMSSWM